MATQTLGANPTEQGAHPILALGDPLQSLPTRVVSAAGGPRSRTDSGDPPESSPITPTGSHTDIERNAIMIGSTYPLLDIFWTMLEIFFFILWFWLLIFIFSDIFRSHDMGGWSEGALGHLPRSSSLCLESSST